MGGLSDCFHNHGAIQFPMSGTDGGAHTRKCSAQSLEFQSHGGGKRPPARPVFRWRSVSVGGFSDCFHNHGAIQFPMSGIDGGTHTRKCSVQSLEFQSHGGGERPPARPAFPRRSVCVGGLSDCFHNYGAIQFPMSGTDGGAHTRKCSVQSLEFQSHGGGKRPPARPVFRWRSVSVGGFSDCFHNHGAIQFPMSGIDGGTHTRKCSVQSLEFQSHGGGERPPARPVFRWRSVSVGCLSDYFHNHGAIQFSMSGIDGGAHTRKCSVQSLEFQSHGGGERPSARPALRWRSVCVGGLSDCFHNHGAIQLPMSGIDGGVHTRKCSVQSLEFQSHGGGERPSARPALRWRLVCVGHLSDCFHNHGAIQFSMSGIDGGSHTRKCSTQSLEFQSHGGGERPSARPAFPRRSVCVGGLSDCFHNHGAIQFPMSGIDGGAHMRKCSVQSLEFQSHGGGGGFGDF